MVIFAQNERMEKKLKVIQTWMQYSAFPCTPQVISVGSTCTGKILLFYEIMMEIIFSFQQQTKDPFQRGAYKGFLSNFTRTGEFATTFLKGGIHRIGFVRSSSSGLVCWRWRCVKDHKKLIKPMILPCFWHSMDSLGFVDLEKAAGQSYGNIY